MSIREANELSRAIKETMHSSLTSRRRFIPGTVSILDLEILPDILLRRMNQTTRGLELLQKSCSSEVPPEYSKKLKSWFKKDVKDITRGEILEVNTRQLDSILDVGETTINRLKLALLGIPTVKKSPIR